MTVPCAGELADALDELRAHAARARTRCGRGAAPSRPNRSSMAERCGAGRGASSGAAATAVREARDTEVPSDGAAASLPSRHAPGGKARRGPASLTARDAARCRPRVASALRALAGARCGVVDRRAWSPHSSRCTLAAWRDERSSATRAADDDAPPRSARRAAGRRCARRALSLVVVLLWPLGVRSAAGGSTPCRRRSCTASPRSPASLWLLAAASAPRRLDGDRPAARRCGGAISRPRADRLAATSLGRARRRSPTASLIDGRARASAASPPALLVQREGRHAGRPAARHARDAARRHARALPGCSLGPYRSRRPAGVGRCSRAIGGPPCRRAPTRSRSRSPDDALRGAGGARLLGRRRATSRSTAAAISTCSSPRASTASSPRTSPPSRTAALRGHGAVTPIARSWPTRPGRLDAFVARRLPDAVAPPRHAG